MRVFLYLTYTRKESMTMFQLLSPDGSLNLSLFLQDGALSYSVTKNGVTLLTPSPVGAITGKADLTCGLEPVSSEEGFIDEQYSLPAFKKSLCLNRCRTLTLAMTRDGYPLTLEARAYNDGAALRLRFDQEDVLKRETTAFGVPAATRAVYAMKFRFSYEDEFNPVPQEDLHQNLWSFPVLLEAGSGVWGLIAEAGVFGDYGGSVLSSTKQDPRMLRITAPADGFSEQPLPVTTPWRVVLAGSLDDIVNSNTLENLNPPCEMEDTGFIKPGLCAWSWMVENSSNKDFYRQRDYIDLAAEMNWPYSLNDGGWKQAKVNIPALVEYARSRGVSMWIWEHRRDLMDRQTADETLAMWKKWGVAGVKVDFFESDTRERIALMDMLAELCAKHKLMLNFHGCTKPAGEIRRWPHILTREGVMGGENLQNYSTEYFVAPTARHNCTLPFTRNAVGPMDFTPVTYGTYRTGTTDAHQTALPIVFTSYICHIAERPEILLRHPCAPFLKGLPAAWDESHLLEGAPACYVTMARRSGEDWYVGSICASRSRVATVDLSFLGEGEYMATLYQDGLEDLRPVDVPIGVKEPLTREQYDEWEKVTSRPTSHHHNLHLTDISSFVVTRERVLEIPCVQDGGFALKLTKR